MPNTPFNPKIGLKLISLNDFDVNSMQVNFSTMLRKHKSALIL